MKRTHWQGRGRILGDALRAMLVLRHGRWTMQELGAELGLQWRTTYRLIEVMRQAGVTVEVSREGNVRGMAPGHYRIPAEPLRRLLRL